MVSRARTINRRILPRDEHVARAMAAAARGAQTHSGYEYSFKWKSGTGRTHDATRIAYNRIQLFGNMIEESARERQDFYVWNIHRGLQYQNKSSDY